MPESDVDVVKRFYAAWNRSDLDGVLDAFDPAGEFRPIFGALFAENHYAGHEAIARWFREVHDAWVDYRIEPERLVEAGDRVITIVRIVARRAAGERLEARAAYVFTVRAGGITVMEGHDADETLVDLGDEPRAPR